MCDFKKDIAVRYGVNAAVIAQFLWDSIEGPDHSGKRVYRDGKKWCRCSILLMTGIFPFLSRHMVSDALERLIKAHVIKKDCLNSNRFDRTNWYAFTEYGEYLMKGGCCYYDRLTGLCGVCMKKILKELKVAREVRSDGDRQNEPEGDEQTVR